MTSELNMTQVKEHFDLPLTAEFITTTLGVPPVREEKRAKFWNAGQIPEIAQALADYALSRAQVGHAPSDANEDLFG